VKAIQERYSKLKSDHPRRQKMNQEMMASTRSALINPPAAVSRC